MPKKTVAPLIMEGIFEYIIRINLSPSAKGKLDKNIKLFASQGIYYVIYEFDKRKFKLPDVIQERNRLLEHYEDLGYRGKKAIKSTKLKQISQQNNL